MSLKLSTGGAQRNLPTKQTGAGLPIALFIVTVLSLIVLGMSQLQESSGKAISLQVQSQRAFFAAESGAQATIASLMKAAGDDPLGCLFGEQLLEFDGQGLSNCRADVTCDDAANEDVIDVQSKGSCGVEDSTDYAQRTVEVRLSVD